MIADRFRNSGRRLHLEHWLKRGDQMRATVAPHTATRQGKHESLMRCRSLECLDSNRVAAHSDTENMRTPCNLRRSFDVLDSNDHHEVIVHRSADDDGQSALRTNSVERSSDLTANDRRSSRLNRDFGNVGSPEPGVLITRHKPSGCDRMEASDQEQLSSVYSKERDNGLWKNKEKLSVAERLEELLSKTNEIIHMERIARRKSREGLAMLGTKQRPSMPPPQSMSHPSMRAMVASQHGSGSGASADGDCHIKKFTRLDYRQPDSCSIESPSIAHEMKRITSSLLDNIGSTNERIIIGKEDDMMASPRYAHERDTPKSNHRSEDERSGEQMRSSMSNMHRKMSLTGRHSGNCDESDISEEQKGHFVHDDNSSFGHNYDDGQYYQSDEVDADMWTNPMANGMSSVNCGFYQNTFFNDSRDVSSSDTINSMQHSKDVENGAGSACEDMDLRYDLPQMANTKDLYELKSRILNGANWRSQVLRKSAFDVNKKGDDDRQQSIPGAPLQSNVVDYKVRPAAASVARARGSKISQLVAKLQMHTSLNATNNNTNHSDDSESSEDELDVDSGDAVDAPSPSNLVPSGKLPMPTNNHMQQPTPFVYNRAQPQVAKTIPSQMFNASGHIDPRSLIPKDAYFHELPNRSHYKPLMMRTSVESSALHMIGRNRNPLPLNMNTDGDILAEQGAANRSPVFLSQNQLPSSLTDGQYTVHAANSAIKHNGTLPIVGQTMNTAQIQAIAEHRDMNNDSGYSNRVCGSSYGPSPSLSGQTDSESIVGTHTAAMINHTSNSIPHTAQYAEHNGNYIFGGVAASSLV